MKKFFTWKRVSSYQQVEVTGDMDNTVDVSVSDNPSTIELKTRDSSDSSAGVDATIGRQQSIKVETYDENGVLGGLSGGLLMWSELAVPCFALIALAAAVGIGLGLAKVTPYKDFIWFMLATDLVGASLGAYGCYKWGAVEEEINRLKRQGTVYESLVQSLRMAIDRFLEEKEDIQDNVDDLRENLTDVSETVKQMEDVYSELLGHSVLDGGKQLMEAVAELNTVCTQMRRYILVNKKAALLSLYYSVCFSDGNVGVSESDYRRLMAHMAKDDRDSFHRMGTFADFTRNDSIIDATEFKELIETVVNELESKLLQDFQESVRH